MNLIETTRSFFGAAGAKTQRAFVIAFTAIALAIGGAAFGASTAYADVALGSAAAASSADIATAATQSRAIAGTVSVAVTGKNSQTEARTILNMVNSVRADTVDPNGKPKTPTAALKWDYELEKVAMQRAAEISLYYSHTRPDGTEFATALPTGYSTWAENLLAASGGMTASSANENWKRSQGHYNNMVNAGFSCMGAASFTIDGVAYWVEVFGNPNHSAGTTTAVDATRTYTIYALPNNLDLGFTSTLPSTVTQGYSMQYAISNTNKPLVAISPTWKNFKTKINNTTFNWSSSNTGVATVDSSGKVIAKNKGSVTITAKNITLQSFAISASSTIAIGAKPSAQNPGSGSSNISTSSNKYKEGWVKSGSRWWYRYSDGSYPTGMKKIGSATYYFDSKGWMKTGWQHATGNSDWYYFAGSGAMKTGWLKTGGKWYYLNSSGKMLTGKQTISGKKYFLNSSGAMHTGWKQEGKTWYFYGPSGAMAKGWAKVGSKWYYLHPSTGVMQTGFYKVGNSTYYSHSSGAMATGWQKISKDWYYFAGSGAMKTGWLKSGKSWYYLGTDGVMYAGNKAYIPASKGIFYFRASGAMVTGWNYENSGWCYYDKSGRMVMSSWISGKYWVGESGYMATNSWVDHGQYYVNGKGEYVKGMKK